MMKENMILKKLAMLFFVTILVNVTQTATAQSTNKMFYGAEATLRKYKD